MQLRFVQQAEQEIRGVAEKGGQRRGVGLVWEEQAVFKTTESCKGKSVWNILEQSAIRPVHLGLQGVYLLLVM